MATQTVEQVQRLAPYLEGLEKRVLQTAFGEFDGTTQKSPGLLDKPLDLPEYQVAASRPAAATSHAAWSSTGRCIPASSSARLRGRNSGYWCFGAGDCDA